jgi:hypothetical protein
VHFFQSRWVALAQGRFASLSREHYGLHHIFTIDHTSFVKICQTDQLLPVPTPWFTVALTLRSLSALSAHSALIASVVSYLLLCRRRWSLSRPRSAERLHKQIVLAA